MRMKNKIGPKKKELEVYKVQVSLFGTPSILIYNECRDQSLQIYNTKQIKQIRKFIGNRNLKAFVKGYLDENNQIVMQQVIPKNISKDYRW